MAILPLLSGTFAFRRYAGSLQLRIATVEELLRVPQLPEAQWVATACPVDGLTCEPAVMRLLDQDGNGRIHARELSEAIRWMGEMLADRSGCVPGDDTVVLARLSPAAEGLRIAAELVLENCGAVDRTRITLAQVRGMRQLLTTVVENGDGIITARTLPAPLAALLEDIRAGEPPLMDRSGDPGVDAAAVARFRERLLRARALLQERTPQLVWGERTAAAAALVRSLETVVDAYFLQCRVIAAQPTAAAAFQADAPAIAAAGSDPARLAQVLATLPLAPHDPSGRLHWSQVFRGAHAEGIAQLRDQVAVPVLGQAAAEALSEAQWRQLVAAVTPWWDWQDRAARDELLPRLGEARVLAIRGEDLEELERRCLADKAVDAHLARVGELERLALYQRWLFKIANNFVAMPHLYQQDERALFEQGTLVLAGREFSLSVLVTDRPAHVAIASESSLFILYCQIQGGQPARSFEVAVPVTSGTSTELFVGRRGVFHAVDGQEYDAQVVQIIVQPVSLWEAFIHPVRRLGALISKRLQSWSDSVDDSLEKQVASRALPVLPVPGSAPAGAAPGAAAPNAMMGLLMGGSVAVAALGSSFAYVIHALEGVPADTIVIGVVLGIFALLLLFALPSLILAAIKILTRQLAVVLEGSGWAMNDNLRLTPTLGLLFTRRPLRPAGSFIDWQDQVTRLVRLRAVGAHPMRALWWLVGSLVPLAVLVGVAWWGWHVLRPAPAPSGSGSPSSTASVIAPTSSAGPTAPTTTAAITK